MRVTALVNRRGGAVADDEDVTARVATALAAAEIDADVALVAGAETEFRARAAAERGDPLLIVGGGDGTVGAAASALAGSGTVLGILPLGTLNHFARDLGIPLDLGEAAALIAGGSDRRVDIAEMNGRAFVNNSVVGLYPLMVGDRDRQRRRLGRSKRLAMAIAAARTLLRFRHHRLTLQVNDLATRVDTPLLFVGNNDYRFELPGAGRRTRLDDGQLCVLVLRRTTRAGFVAATLRALVGRARPNDLVRLDDVERLRVGSSRHRLPVSLDGEALRVEPPLDYAIRKRALRVIAP